MIIKRIFEENHVKLGPLNVNHISELAARQMFYKHFRWFIFEYKYILTLFPR